MNLITASLADEYCLSHSATKLAEQPSEKWELAEFEPYSRHWDFVSLSYADDICLASRFVKLRIWNVNVCVRESFAWGSNIETFPLPQAELNLGLAILSFSFPFAKK